MPVEQTRYFDTKILDVTFLLQEINSCALEFPYKALQVRDVGLSARRAVAPIGAADTGRVSAISETRESLLSAPVCSCLKECYLGKIALKM